MLALDLFCGGGGACIGLQRAGFEVVGIDIKPHPNYPAHFIQADIHDLPVDVMDFDFVWASPPCQLFSTSGCRWGKEKRDIHANLIPLTRKLLEKHPFACIENIPQSPLRPDLTLVGSQVGLDTLWRKRFFELSFICWQPPKVEFKAGTYYTITSSMGCGLVAKEKRQGKRELSCLTPIEYKHIMGIPICQKMNKLEVAEAIPPAYSEYIAREALRQMRL